MKKLFYFFFIMILFNSKSFSQSRLGYTESQIRSEFSEQVFSTSYTEKGTKYIHFTNERLLAMYFFNEENICFLCSATPLNGGVLNYMVENFNKKYVIISDTSWKYYTENGLIIYIDLVETNGTMSFFYRQN